jgi:hypothetical protein
VWSKLWLSRVAARTTAQFSGFTFAACKLDCFLLLCGLLCTQYTASSAGSACVAVSQLFIMDSCLLLGHFLLGHCLLENKDIAPSDLFQYIQITNHALPSMPSINPTPPRGSRLRNISSNSMYHAYTNMHCICPKPHYVMDVISIQNSNKIPNED